jgi:sucrose-6F-phosphate phosphohydrolase
MTPLKLLCTDLDRTLLPNGHQAEFPGARQRLAQRLRQADIKLVFVTGRDQALVRNAMVNFELPAPDYVIADVGTTIYRCINDAWQPYEAWHQRIGADWRYLSSERVFEMIAGIDHLRLQEAAKQGRYKLSFYVALEHAKAALFALVREKLLQYQFDSHLIYSVDEEKGVGLLDVVPASAGKLTAIRHLQSIVNVCDDEVLFAGDSGNDLDVLCSDLPAVLVANASPEVRSLAQGLARKQGTESRLYVATGREGNGYYASGIIEGINHFFSNGDCLE